MRRGAVLLSACIAAAALPAASLALADAFDPSHPLVVPVGPSPGAAPAFRLDAERTGRARTKLPDAPAEVWRRQLGGGLELPPVVDAKGAIVAVLATGEVVKLSADGTEQWRMRLRAPASESPLLRNDGVVVLATGSGEAVGITPSGATAFTEPLAVRGRDLDVGPVMLDDGGAAFAAGRALVIVGRAGKPRARAEAEARVAGALLAGPEGIVFTTDDGAAFAWRPPAEPRLLGRFGGSVRRGLVRADSRTLVGVVDGQELVALDVPTGTTHVVASAAPGDSFEAPPAVGPSGALFVATSSGALERHATGEPAMRVALERTRAVPFGDAGAGFFPAAAQTASPPLVVDAEGRVGFVRSEGRAGVVRADGHVAVAVERVCRVPVALMPAGAGAMVVACRDGTIVRFAGG